MKTYFITLLYLLLSLSQFQAANLNHPFLNKSQNPTKLRLLTQAVTEDGQITLQKDLMGYYVSVDFEYNPDNASDSEGDDPYIGTMGLALYTSETLLTESCLQFSEYDCSSYTCTPYTDSTTVRYYPYFEVEGYYAAAGVYLDYSYWELANHPTIATSCTGNTYDPLGTSRYGLIGLGFGATYSNFMNSNIFSINLERSGSGGTLMFQSNSNVTAASKQVAVLNADANWHINASNSTLKIGDTSINFSARLIFDLDADAIGLPSSIYESFLENFQTANPNVPCNDATDKPTCSYNGKIGDLKTIKLHIQGYKIKIPPTVYVQGITDADTDLDSSFTLNIRCLDSTLTGHSYVTREYENYIILDQNFLSYYYAEFAADSDSNTYNVTLATQYYTSKTPIWPFIVGGSVGFLIVVTCVICCVKKRINKRRKEALKKVAQTGAINSSDQAPLTENDQATADNNVQSSAQNNYHPPYSYSYEQNGYNGYPQQYQNAQHGYGNMPGYTYIPQAGGYPYLPAGQAQGAVSENRPENVRSQ